MLKIDENSYRVEGPKQAFSDVSDKADAVQSTLRQRMQKAYALNPEDVDCYASTGGIGNTGGLCEIYIETAKPENPDKVGDIVKSVMEEHFDGGSCAIVHFSGAKVLTHA